MDVSTTDSDLSRRTSLRCGAISVLGGAVIVTAAGVVSIATAGPQAMTQLTRIIIVLIAEFSVATFAYLALQRTRSSVSSMEGGRSLRNMAVAALVISVSAILFVSWFTWILGTHFKVPL